MNLSERKICLRIDSLFYWPKECFVVVDILEFWPMQAQLLLILKSIYRNKRVGTAD